MDGETAARYACRTEWRREKHFFESHLKPLGLPFLNAANLARVADSDAYTAADTIASVRDGFIQRRESFVTETEFSGPVGEKLRVLENAAASGFDVTLMF